MNLTLSLPSEYIYISSPFLLITCALFVYTNLEATYCSFSPNKPELLAVASDISYLLLIDTTCCPEASYSIVEYSVSLCSLVFLIVTLANVLSGLYSNSI